VNARTQGNDPPPLTDADLISNSALRESDTDDFGYGAIAGRVAETIVALRPPLTLGLFGPWGSGKTSMYELLRRELASARSRKIQLVYYDASTYGGEALKRNFISHIATELGYEARKYPEFHQGLYESRRRTELDFQAVKKTLRPTAFLFAGLYIGFLLLFCGLAGLTSLGTDENFFGQVGKSLPQLIAPAAIGGLVIAVASLLLKGASLDAEQSQPASDEAFAKCFQSLVERGREDGKFKRLVVFVDELDRCSSEDVVTTLTAIRTFLTQKHAVFVVAADRAALERALDEKLPQPTPVNEEDPYYSSASSFFDKIFHDRVPLPPLRGPRLYEWAFDKVKDRGGYWAALRGGSDQKLRKILYFLIPSHVRAPRRVKVLLNSFIRSTAIAAHSGLDWEERSREIAKLTVLDTEFPLVGSDLRVEPRLPELLLSPPEDPSERVLRLLNKHGSYRISHSKRDGTSSQPEPTTEQEEAEEPTDQVLANATDGEREALVHAEHEQLRRYLARTRDVRIGRDLLFLDRAGAAVGIEDVELADLLDQAVDVPDDVVDALDERDDATRQLAARVLADMAEREFGEERINVMTALMGVVELLGSDVEAVADEIAGSVHSFARDEELAPQQLVGALTLAVSEGGAQGFQAELLADDRLLADPERVTAVALMLPRISLGRRAVVYSAVADLVATDRARFLSVLRGLPKTEAAELVESDPVYSAIFRYLGPDAGEAGENNQFADELYSIAAGEGGAPLRKALQNLLSTEEICYQPLKEHSTEVFEDFDDPVEKDREALLVLLRFGYRDPSFWTSFLSEGGYDSAKNGATAVRALAELIQGITELEADDKAERLQAIERIAPIAGMAEQADRQPILESLEAELGGAPWWIDEQSREKQQWLHELGQQLQVLVPGAIDALALDLQRVLADPAGFTEETWKGLLQMGVALGPRAASILESMNALGDGEPWPVWVTRVRTGLAVAASAAGASVDVKVVPEQEVLRAASAGSGNGDEAVADWLRLGPGRSAVMAMIETLDGRVPKVILRSFEIWAEQARDEERSAFACELVDKQLETSPWMEGLVQAGVDEVIVVAKFGKAVDAASRGSRREELMSALAQLKPVSSAAQKAVADLVIELVESNKQVDFRAATKAIPALGQEHRSAGRLRKAFQDAADVNGYQLNERAAHQLAEAGVRVPKKAVKKSAWSSIKSRFR
jgi:KAP family P-loop domain